MTLRLLLVEDDQPTRDELGEILEKEQLEVHRASDGTAGLEAFQSVQPDIVITDLKMPGMSGLELMRKAKALRPEVPVILITAYGETDTAIDALRIGALDYFKKPVELEELLVAVGRAKEVVHKHQRTEDFPLVLLAEDDDLTRTTLAEVLEKESWHVLQAADGQAAVELFKRHRIDALLVDIKMPKLDGINALKQMRGLRQDFEAIILTGYGDESAAIQALRHGAMSFIRKPVDLEEVLVTLDKAKEKVSLARALQYRSREVELAKQIIAQISEHGEIVLRVSDSTLEDARQRVATALGHLTDAVAIIDDRSNVVFANSQLLRVLGGRPDQLDAEAVQRAAQASQGKLGADAITDCLQRTRRGPLGGIETCPPGGQPALFCAKARARVGAESRDYLLVVLCG